MSNMTDFFAESSKHTIADKEYDIIPATVEQLPNIHKSRSDDIDVKEEAIVQLAFSVFKQIFPESTMDDFNKVSLGVMNDLLLAFWDVNEDDESKIKTKLLAQANK